MTQQQTQKTVILTAEFFKQFLKSPFNKKARKWTD